MTQYLAVPLVVFLVHLLCSLLHHLNSEHDHNTRFVAIGAHACVTRCFVRRAHSTLNPCTCHMAKDTHFALHCLMLSEWEEGGCVFTQYSLGIERE